MSTRHVILALLDIQPMSGYDLSQNLDISVSSLWAATYGQLYPMLHKMADEGLIQGEAAQSTSKRKRIVYRITDSGQQALRDWINQPVSYLPNRNPFMLWATYVDVAEDDVVFDNIDHHIARQTTHAQRLDAIADQIEAETHPLIKARKSQLEPARFAQLKASRALIFREMAHQARESAASAERIRQHAITLRGASIPFNPTQGKPARKPTQD